MIIAKGAKMKFLNVVIILLLGFILNCSSQNTADTIDPDQVMVFPEPPEVPRVQFLTKISSSSDVIPPSKLDAFLFGSSLMKLEKVIEKPYGIEIRDGLLYIVDSKLPGLEIIDFKNQTFEVFQPYGRATMKKPINIALDKDGNIYISDMGRKQVVVYSPQLKYLKTLGSPGMKPVDVAVWGDSLLIADMEDNNLEVWSISAGKMIGEFPPPNMEYPDSVKLVEPYAIEVNKRGDIYVTDFGQFRVIQFDRKGNFVQKYGGLGRNLGQFARPKGVAVDADENVYVVDTAFENIQIFDKDGKLLMFFGGAYEKPGHMYIPAQVIIDYENVEYFRQYVLPGFGLDYIILVTNQFGPDKIGIYGMIHPL